MNASVSPVTATAAAVAAATLATTSAVESLRDEEEPAEAEDPADEEKPADEEEPADVTGGWVSTPPPLSPPTANDVDPSAAGADVAAKRFAVGAPLQSTAGPPVGVVLDVEA